MKPFYKASIIPVAILISLSVPKSAFSTGLTTYKSTAFEKATQNRPGFAIVLGADAAAIGLHLASSQNRLVHMLVKPEGNLSQIQTDIMNQGSYGLVSAEAAFDWKALPYGSGIANTIVVDNLKSLQQKGLALNEIARVLVAGGTLLINRQESGIENSGDIKNLLSKLNLNASEALSVIEEDSQWLSLKKAAALDTDDWTHWDHGPDGNALSADTKVAPPTHIKWSSGSETTLSKSGPFPGFRISNGVAYYMHVDSRPTANKNKTEVWARDANNGSKLWMRSDVMNFGGERNNWVPFTLDDKYLYTLATQSGPTLALDLKTGNTVKTYSDIKPKGPINLLGAQLAAVDGKLIQFAGQTIHVIDPVSGKVFWSKDAGSGVNYLGGIASKEANKVFAIVTKSKVTGERWRYAIGNEEIVAYNLENGNKEWSNTDAQSYAIGQLVYYNGTVGYFGGNAIIGAPSETAAIGMINASSGKTKWKNQYGSIVSKVPWHDSKMGGLSMAMRGNQAIVNYGPNTIFWDIENGAYKFWRADIAKTGEDAKKKVYGLHACTKGVLTTNYATTGLVIWIDNQMKYEFLPLRRAGCAMPGFPANGMTYYAPATCGCIPELNGGDGFVALGQEGTRIVADDNWRFVETSGSEYKISNGTTRTLSILKKTTNQMALNNAIVSDWPEFRTSGTLAKQGAATQVSANGYTVTTTGSLLGVEITKDGKGIGEFVTGGRVTAKPVILNDMAFVGSHDGYLYAYDLKSSTLKWRSLMAPYDQRILYSSQLESNWPVTQIAIENNELTAQAGRQYSNNGGIFYYGINPTDGSILWKKRSVIPEEGVFSDPERGFVMVEKVALNEVPILQNSDIGSKGVFRSKVNPILKVNANQIILSVEPGPVVPYTISVVNISGKVLLKQNGFISESLEIPTQKLSVGRYYIQASVAGEKLSQQLSLTRVKNNPLIH